MDKYTYLTFDQRHEIEKLYNADVPVAEIAAQIGRSVAAVYAELKRGHTGERNANKRKIYCADRAQTVFQDNIAKRGNRQSTASG